jgi:NifU-like protein involved in Fe-S cluster formation
MAYSEKVLDHYENPRNVGTLDKDSPDVGTGMVGAPACGDVMKLQIEVHEGIITDAKFKTYGCGSAIASSSLVTELLKGRQVTYPATLQTGKWYALVVETVNDEMRVTIDGKPTAYLKSSGIAHATKSKIELGVAGKDGFFDDLKVWNAAPAK